MAEKTDYCGSKALKGTIGNITIYLYRTWDIVHGKGWFVRSVNENLKLGFGFHKHNRFTAVREALKTAP